MNRIIRRSTAPVALLALALAAAAPAAGAEPADIVLDASVTVVFVESGEGGAPIPDATVTLEARITDFPEDPALAVLHGITDALGSVTFGGVPRGGATGPTVHLAIAAHAEQVTTDASFCRTSRSWSGLVIDVASPPSQPVVVTESGGSSSVVCRAVAGRIVDRAGNVHPADPALSRISIELPDGGGAMSFPLALAVDGTFRQALPAWGSHESPAVVTVRYVSATRTEAAGGCVRTLAEAVTWEEPLALETEDAPSLELVASDIGGEACGAISTPPPPNVSVTLPPTDSGTVPGRGPASTAGVLVAVGLLAVASGLALGRLAGRDRRRRR